MLKVIKSTQQDWYFNPSAWPKDLFNLSNVFDRTYHDMQYVTNTITTLIIWGPYKRYRSWTCFNIVYKEGFVLIFTSPCIALFNQVLSTTCISDIKDNRMEGKQQKKYPLIEIWLFGLGWELRQGANNGQALVSSCFTWWASPFPQRGTGGEHGKGRGWAGSHANSHMAGLVTTAVMALCGRGRLSKYTKWKGWYHDHGCSLKLW